MIHKRAFLGILALGAVGAVAAGDALALSEGWYVPYPGSGFTCAAGRAQTEPADHLLSLAVAEGHIDIRDCEALCAANARCVSYAYTVTYAASGAERDYCALYSDRDTRHTKRFEGGRFDYAMMCYRKLSWQERIAQQDYGQQHIRQDDFRPGLPGAAVSIPSAPHKH